MDDELFSFPYDSISETWRRIVFYMAVLETNQESILLLDEPEANTFPFYTAYLAERIALDESNQFFLTTHNPYILSSIVGKTPVKDLAVFVATMENFCTTTQTRVGGRISKDSRLRAGCFPESGQDRRGMSLLWSANLMKPWRARWAFPDEMWNSGKQGRSMRASCPAEAE